MEEQPIVMDAESVRAILETGEWQIWQRIVPQPEQCANGWMFGGEFFADDEQMESHLFHDVYGTQGGPYGSVYVGDADRLWVQEAWQKAKSDIRMDGTSPVAYMATDAHPATGYGPHGDRWESPESMPRWASRLTIEVVDVRPTKINYRDAFAWVWMTRFRRVEED